jgi:hypothetical protein
MFYSIKDTMKTSRDLAREKLQDSSYDADIETQIVNIAATGATHVAIATPYDDEFYPYLTRWVNSARKNNLKVWFRGNWSGWENWFGYPDITRAEHISKTKDFILKHSDLFQNGDIFSSCPECENGGPGDPRLTHDVVGYRHFLIDLYRTTSDAFNVINKQVISNYFSSNGDVARLIWDHETTKALGGVVVIDHYVATPQKLIQDIKSLSASSGGRIVLGEFGAPIPDIHGSMSEQKQQQWISQALALLASTSEVIGINYWTNLGSSTSIWKSINSPTTSVQSLASFYSPKITNLHITNEIGKPIVNTIATFGSRAYPSNSAGVIRLPLASDSTQITISAPGYESHGLLLNPSSDNVELILVKTQENWLFKLQKLTYRLISGILH